MDPVLIQNDLEMVASSHQDGETGVLNLPLTGYLSKGAQPAPGVQTNSSYLQKEGIRLDLWFSIFKHEIFFYCHTAFYMGDQG